jgi:uncharacterized membrane protein YphA (DoxX/SURF4 family)
LKLLFLRADEIDLVQRSGLVWHSPQLTLQMMGLGQIAVGLWLLSGFRERAAVALATIWMTLLIILVAGENPMTNPYGALVKDFCLLACALTVWILLAISTELITIRRTKTSGRGR